MLTSETQKPKPHPFYGDSYERGKDPWHSNDFPDEFKARAPHQGQQAVGWFLIDGAGNQIGFVADGTEL